MAVAEPITPERPHRINGFEYEIGAAMRCIRAEQMESSVIPLEETRRMMGWMDALLLDCIALVVSKNDNFGITTNLYSTRRNSKWEFSLIQFG